VCELRSNAHYWLPSVLNQRVQFSNGKTSADGSGGRWLVMTKRTVVALSVRQQQAIEAYIEGHLSDGLCIVDLSTLLGCSPDHFARRFRKTFGTNPWRYVVLCRVRRAKHLMRTSNRSLVAIALDCGFASQAHFTVMFKRFVGTTPGRYRIGEMGVQTVHRMTHVCE
jgi:AraC-like DNA-binding protein